MADSQVSEPTVPYVHICKQVHTARTLCLLLRKIWCMICIIQRTTWEYLLWKWDIEQERLIYNQTLIKVYQVCFIARAASRRIFFLHIVYIQYRCVKDKKVKLRALVALTTFLPYPSFYMLDDIVLLSPPHPSTQITCTSDHLETILYQSQIFEISYWDAAFFFCTYSIYYWSCQICCTTWLYQGNVTFINMIN